MCYTKRGLGTFVTEDAAVFKALRESMAQEFISNFIKAMQDLGYSKEELLAEVSAKF